MKLSEFDNQVPKLAVSSSPNRLEITMLSYNNSKIIELQKETKNRDFEAIKSFLQQDNNFTHWIKIVGINDNKGVKEFSKQLNLHPLTIENVLSKNQRPKLGKFPDYLFLVVRMAHIVKRDESIKIKQLSLVIGYNYIISSLKKKILRLLNIKLTIWPI